MRRWFMLFMLIVLPLQFTSAAAATYCRHESSGLAKHFGHHEHRHKAVSDGKPSLSSMVGDLEKSSAFGDFDCEYCHLAAVYPLLTGLVSPNAVVEQTTATEALFDFGSRDPDEFERPNWSSLA